MIKDAPKGEESRFDASGNETRHSFADRIMVIPLDEEKLLRSFVKQCKGNKDMPKIMVKTHEVRGKIALIQNTECITDTEAVHVPDGDMSVGVYRRDEVDPENPNHKKFYPFTSIYLDISAKHFEDFGKKPITLREFMGTRFDYNGRMKSNLEILMETAKSWT